MSAGVAYEVLGVPGNNKVVALGTAADPSIIFGNPNALGGLNDGLFATSTPTVGISINGTATFVVGATGFGYPTGVGGAVTQATNRTTAVTLNTITGTITTNTASLAAEASAKFTVNNTQVAIGDVVVVSQQSGSNGGDTSVEVTTVAAGSFQIMVANNNAAAGTAETGAILINFAVIKAVSA